MTKKPNLRDKIEELKHMQKRTFTSIASGIGFTDAALRRLLDRNDCKLSTLYKLAEVLNVSVIELLLSDDEIQEIQPDKEQLGSGKYSSCVKDLNNCKDKVEMLQVLLKSKDDLITSKNEIITELRKEKR